MSNQPTLIAFLLANSITKTPDGYCISNATPIFRTPLTRNISIDFSAYICLTNIRRDTKLYFELSTADEQSGGHKNHFGTLIAADPLTQLTFVAHFPNTPFPHLGKYIARLHANDAIIAQTRFSIEPPLP